MSESLKWTPIKEQSFWGSSTLKFKALDCRTIEQTLELREFSSSSVNLQGKNQVWRKTLTQANNPNKNVKAVRIRERYSLNSFLGVVLYPSSKTRFSLWAVDFFFNFRPKGAGRNKFNDCYFRFRHLIYVIELAQVRIGKINFQK